MIAGETGRVVPSPTAADRFAALFERCSPAVLRYAYRRTGDWALSEEVTAQTFLQAWQAWPRYEERGVPPLAWVLRIASGVMADYGRRRRREAALLPALALAGAYEAAEAMARERDRDRVNVLLATLPAEQRRAVWLRYGADHTIDEVAALIGRSPSATKQLIHRAAKRLRTHYDDV